MFCHAFERRVAATPDAPAIEFRDQRLSYRELADRSARLAAELIQRGVGRERIVGVAARPSLDLPVAILGIMRAGGAWLPLDPSYPAERLQYMVTDSGVTLVLADPESAKTLAADGLEVLDPASTPTGQPVHELPALDPAPGDIAYVIYTSGSTGRPKGVAVTHGGLANLAHAQALTFGVTPSDRVLQFAPISFDASVFEMAMALAAGATLVLAPREDIPPGPELADFLRSRRISNLTLPPSVLATLPDTELPDLRVLICAGEALPEHLVEQWSPGRRMFNAYGPTETTVWASTAEPAAGGGKPAIGTAIPGAHVLVVDELLRPVPAGTPGELAIGGRGVGRGYLGRPGLTAERFVPDPESAEPGGRIYRTGDRVVLGPDGELEFLGRIDHQVKIRGFRIEPDEIARRLAEVPGVTDAVVVPRDRGAGVELAGYATGAGLDVDRLRAHLAERLPGYMIPADLVLLEKMPLTPSGKIDRAALPAPAHGGGDPNYLAPVTATEQALAGILAELLQTDRVGAADDFFALGGHSLLAGRLAARVRTELGRELSLRQLYEARTVSAIARIVDAADPAIAVPPIRVAANPPGTPAPLSFPQERIWFLEELAPGNLAYNAQATVRLRGPLDSAALHGALTEIVRRHEIFRTSFQTVAGAPVQIPRPPMPVTVPLVEVDGELHAEEVIAAAMRVPFNLATPPLVRWILIRHSEQDHSLVHIEHHLVHDGWSWAVFLHEFQALYQAFASGRPSPLPEPEAQYTDFARWQREWMSGAVLEAYLRHWTAELAGGPAALDLPTDRPRPPAQSFAGSAVRIDLPADLCRRLRAYSTSRGITLYATMLAGFGALMSRYSGQHDVVVGSGVANRRLAEIERMMGMVVNTLPLRIDLAGGPGFDRLSRTVHDTVGRAHEWQDVPLDRLVDALAPPRDPSRNPLFQVMFSFHDSQIPDLDFDGGLHGTVLERHNRSAKTDLNVVVIPRAEQRAGHGVGADDAPITLIWEYATDLFDEPTMQAMVEHYTNLLGAAMEDPELAFDRLPLLTAEQTRQIIDGSRGPAGPYPAERTIPELFAEQVALRPDAAALVCGDRTYTYAQLDERANRLAQLLRSRGIGLDQPVGVLLERGDEMITALLATVKAGGGYVPLDPGYPAERLSWMVGDVGAKLVITRSDLADRIGPGTPLLCLDQVAAELAAAPAAAPEPAARPDGLAYILFTSGSTGRPKGVMVEHRSVLRLVCETDYVAFGPAERFAQVADASFDAFTFELWGALLHGGALCVISTDVLLTAGGLGEAIARHKVTSMFLTSALFTEVMTDHPGSFANMTNLLVGGDVLNVSRIRRLLEGPVADRPARLMNGYGPTETTTFAICGLIESLPPDAPSVPIGRPIANTAGYVLDRHLRPVPAGVLGELFIGGPGVARGYANRPALTAERFLPDPFGPSGARMYRTGDIVRYLRNGTIEFLGRADGQVKIRGFRIEPGEVEAALTGHPCVRQATVVVDEAPSGRRLVAYVVPTDPEAVIGGMLREFLAAKLPPYLLPAVFVELPGLPMTPSGKIDRSALPAVPDGGPRDGTDRVAPRNETERDLAELFAQALGVAHIGVTDDFFTLGGHSLLAMRLVSRSNELFAAKVALREFLHEPTVARLAAEVTATRGAARAAAGNGSTAETDQLLLDRLDELSDDEVDALLRDLAEDEVER